MILRVYTKKPIVAIQYSYNTEEEVKSFLGDSNYSISAVKGIVIHTLKGNLRLTYGDYVIRGKQGEFYSCKPDIFEATYDISDISVYCTQCKTIHKVKA